MKVIIGISNAYWYVYLRWGTRSKMKKIFNESKVLANFFGIQQIFEKRNKVKERFEILLIGKNFTDIWNKSASGM